MRMRRTRVNAPTRIHVVEEVLLLISLNKHTKPLNFVVLLIIIYLFIFETLNQIVKYTITSKDMD